MAGAVSAPRQLRAAPRAVAIVPGTPAVDVVNAAEAVEAAPKKPKVDLGVRFSRGMHLLRREPALGIYEEVNSPALTQTEDVVQRALLAPVTDPASLQRIEAARTARRVTTGASQ